MDVPSAESRSDADRAPVRRNRYGLFSLELTASTLCFPLAVLAVAGLALAAAFEPFCYAWLLQTWPDLTLVYSPRPMPPVFVAWAITCATCSAVMLAASLTGFLVRRPWALSMLRKACVVAYLLCAVYFCMVIGVIGRVSEVILAAHGSPPPGFVLDRFYWSCQWLAPAVPVVLFAALLHVCSWRRDAVTLYHRTEDSRLAAGDRVIENVRTHGCDPRFRKSVYGSALAHLLVIIIIPCLLTFRGGCIRPYRVPKGSGNPTVAMMKIIQKKKKKKRKKYILSIDSSIIFDVPDLDDSELIREIDEETQLTYVADTSAAHGAMGTGGGNKPGWADGLEGGQIRFIRLEYDGPDWNDGMDPSQAADANFLAEFRKLSGGLDCARDGESHPISHLHKYPEGEAPPFVYMTGSSDIRVSKSDIETLREYIRSGGMLIADAGSRHWDRNFRAFARTLFPGNPLLKISEDDPIFQIPFTFPNGPPPLWFHGGRDAMGVKYRGRWGVFYFPGDMNDAWKTGHSGLDPELAEAAFHLGANVVYYSITHYLQETRKHRK